MGTMAMPHPGRALCTACRQCSSGKHSHNLLLRPKSRKLKGKSRFVSERFTLFAPIPQWQLFVVPVCARDAGGLPRGQTVELRWTRP